MKISIPGITKEQSILFIVLIGSFIYYGFFQTIGLVNNLFTILFEQLQLEFWTVALPSLITEILVIVLLIILIIRVWKSSKPNRPLSNDIDLSRRRLFKLAITVAVISILNYTASVFVKMGIEDYIAQLPDIEIENFNGKNIINLKLASSVISILEKLLVFLLFIVLILKLGSNLNQGSENEAV